MSRGIQYEPLLPCSLANKFLLLSRSYVAPPPQQILYRPWASVGACLSITSKSAPPVGMIQAPTVPWAISSPHPKQHLDQFVRFSTANACDQHSQTDHVTVVKPHLMLHIMMRPENKGTSVQNFVPLCTQLGHIDCHMLSAWIRSLSH